jgi:hypothetical protein
LLLHRPQALPFFRGRDVEADAAEADLAGEKVYE